VPLILLYVVTALIGGMWIFPVTASPAGCFPILRPEYSLISVATSKGISTRVLWTVSGYKIGKGAVWNEDEAQKLLFKPLDIEAAAITFDGRTCRNVIFRKEKVNAKEYLERLFHTTPQSLDIEREEVEVIKTNCDLEGFAEYMRLEDRRLVIHLYGVFFYFEPAVNY
jgi:hypothetical protein